MREETTSRSSTAGPVSPFRACESRPNALIKTARRFLLCNKQNTPLIRFRLITLPKRYLVIDTEILDKTAGSILEIDDLDIEQESIVNLNERLSMYLKSQQRDYRTVECRAAAPREPYHEVIPREPCSGRVRCSVRCGCQLDDFIIKKLQLNPAVTNFGRLDGMEYLIDLLHYHFYDREHELYVTCEEAGTISFFHDVPCWQRLLLDFPVTYEYVKTLQEDDNYVSET